MTRSHSKSFFEKANEQDNVSSSAMSHLVIGGLVLLLPGRAHGGGHGLLVGVASLAHLTDVAGDRFLAAALFERNKSPRIPRCLRFGAIGVTAVVIHAAAINQARVLRAVAARCENRLARRVEIRGHAHALGVRHLLGDLFGVDRQREGLLGPAGGAVSVRDLGGLEKLAKQTVGAVDGPATGFASWFGHRANRKGRRETSRGPRQRRDVDGICEAVYCRLMPTVVDRRGFTPAPSVKSS
jgi:hypothetical protein